MRDQQLEFKLIGPCKTHVLVGEGNLEPLTKPSQDTSLCHSNDASLDQQRFSCYKIQKIKQELVYLI